MRTSLRQVKQGATTPRQPTETTKSGAVSCGWAGCKKAATDEVVALADNGSDVLAYPSCTGHIPNWETTIEGWS